MQPAVRTNLTDTAIQNIRAEITASRWQIGERIPNEATLADMLGVSRGTVREAVRVLVSQGILETRQGSGTYVRSVIERFPPEERAALVGDDGMIRVDCEFCATSFPIAAELGVVSGFGARSA